MSNKPPRCIYLLLFLFLSVAKLDGQDYYGMCIPSLTEGFSYNDALGLNLRGVGFFRNNEYASDLVADYTLPGYRLAADMVYRPRTKTPVQLRLGFTHIYYWGASLYPAALAYQDLPYWQGDKGEYTRFRIKPFFQASILPTKGLAVILGSLEGGCRHSLIEPIYNPELNLTADHESGAQIKYITERTKIDLWVDWQSFIYKHADHPEAFASGLNLTQQIFQKKEHKLELALQMLTQHRGGVLNEKPDTVHSWGNGALGIKYQRAVNLKQSAQLWISGYILGYMQRGEHYISNKGWGLYTEGGLNTESWQLRLALWRGDNFISVMGNPFVQSIGREGRKVLHSRISKYLQMMASYKLLERKNYTFGTSASVWWHPHSSHNFSSHIELYLSISPYIRLRR